MDFESLQKTALYVYWQIQAFVESEGTFRIIEHLIVLYVLVQIIQNIFKI